MRDFLNKLIANKEAKLAEIRTAVNEAQTADEVRSLTAEAEAISAEIAEARAQLAKLDTPPTGGFNPIATYGAQQRSGNPDIDADPTSTIEYRSAFMAYVTGKSNVIPQLENRAAQDGAVVPTILVNRIVEKLETVGTIYKLVNHTSYRSGVEIPRSDFVAVATWVSEGSSSDRQRSVYGKVSFVNKKLRCELATSLEVSVQAIPAFEAHFVDTVSKAMIKAIEQSIINGTGDGEPEGILTAEHYYDHQFDELTYKDLCDIEADVPSDYDATAKWCMTKRTFMAIQGMMDSNKQPVGRTSVGIDGKPVNYILGREVVFADSYLPSIKQAQPGQVYAFIFNFEDYAFNTAYDVTVEKRTNWDTEDKEMKAVLLGDGKVVDNNSLVIVRKKLPQG